MVIQAAVTIDIGMIVAGGLGIRRVPGYRLKAPSLLVQYRPIRGKVCRGLGEDL